MVNAVEGPEAIFVNSPGRRQKKGSKGLERRSNIDNTLHLSSDHPPIGSATSKKPTQQNSRALPPDARRKHEAHNREGKSRAFPAPKRNDLKERLRGLQSIMRTSRPVANLSLRK